MKSGWNTVWALFLILAGCGLSEGDDSSDGDDTPSYSLEPGGATAAPTVDQGLSNQTPEETDELMVAASGGSLTLSDGMTLDVPGGAVAAGAEITVSRYALEGASVGNQSTSLYSFTSTAAPTSEVTITFPVPGDQPIEDESDVFVIWYHEGESTPLAGDVDSTARTVRITTSTFSSGVVRHQGSVGQVAGTTFVPRVPYYNQGRVGNCWSLSLTMLLNAYGAHIEPWDANAYLGISEEHGLNWDVFLYEATLPAFIHQHVSSTVNRLAWWISNDTQWEKLKRHLQALLSQGHPVMAFLVNEGHMVLLVGVDGDQVVIHDPAEGGPYQRRTWDSLRSGFEPTFGWNEAGLLWLEDPVPSQHEWEASLNIHFPKDSRGISFFRDNEEGGGLDESSRRVFSWYIPSSRISGIADLATHSPAVLNPEHFIVPRIEVTNIVEGSPAKMFRIGFEFWQPDTSGTMVFASTERTVNLAGGRFDEFTLNGPRSVQLEESGVDDSGVYTMRFYVSDGTTRYDTATIPFDVVADPEETCQQILRPDSDYASFEFLGDVNGMAGEMAFASEGDIALSPSSTAGRFSVDVQFYGLNFQVGELGCVDWNGGLNENFVPGGVTVMTLPPESGHCWMRCPNPENPDGAISQDATGGSMTLTLSSTCGVQIQVSATGDTCSFEGTFVSTMLF